MAKVEATREVKQYVQAPKPVSSEKLDELAYQKDKGKKDKPCGVLAYGTIPMVQPGASSLATTPSGCSDVAVS